MKRTFTIKACWDEDAKVFYSESDITGLHIETATLEEFEEVMQELAVELILANHVSDSDIANNSVRDLVPAILWQRPDSQLACA